MVSPYCAVRKDYIKTPTLNKTKMRLPFMKREKTTIIKLRLHNYSINQIAVFTGRSTSVIHRIIHKYFSLTQKLFNELRKLPNHTRLTSAKKQRSNMDYYVSLWTPFILGEEDKPP